MILKHLLESIQGIRKRPTYRFEYTIVWERWYFWGSEINIDYRLIQCIRRFCSSPLPIFRFCLQVPWIDSKYKFKVTRSSKTFFNIFKRQFVTRSLRGNLPLWWITVQCWNCYLLDITNQLVQAIPSFAHGIYDQRNVERVFVCFAFFSKVSGL